MTAEVNVEQQRRLYGEPLATLAGRIQSAFGLTQAGLAEILGLSAPMLSQLLSGRRAKIGNPAVLGRLQDLIALAEVAPSLTSGQVSQRLAEIREAVPTITSSRPVLAGLRQAAGPEELERLAGLSRSPALAQLLRDAAADG
ncbi:MAG: XRE family transcriptional regulator [Actinomycetia bacterium]|nr:XRE family transcriptional regulator [Actinomycetes bacterium]